MYFLKDGSALCANCYAERPERETVNVFTGKKVWVGSEVYGKRLGSDELRADTEASITKRNWPPWFEDRMKSRGMSDRL